MKKLTYKQRSEIAHFNFISKLGTGLINRAKFWWKNREKLRQVNELRLTAEVLGYNGKIWLAGEINRQADRIWVDVYAPKE